MNIEADLQIIRERLAKAERHSRALQWFIVVALLLWVPLMLLKFSQPKRFVEAEGFVLKDASGTVRGTFGLLEEDSFLHLYDGRGELQLALAVAPVGPSISIYDSEKNLRGKLSATQKTVEFILYSETKESRVALAMTKKGPVFTLSDAGGIDRARLGVRSKEEGKEQLSQEDYAVAIFDKTGNVIFSGP